MCVQRIFPDGLSFETCAAHAIEVSNIDAVDNSGADLPFAVLRRRLEHTTQGAPQTAKLKAVNATILVSEPAGKESSLG